MKMCKRSSLGLQKYHHRKGGIHIGRNSFVRQYKLSNVCGRTDYIGNPKRQEHLYATYSTVEPEFWTYLAEQNQYDFKRSSSKGKCIEARELVIALPESFVDYDPNLLLQLFTEKFRSTYDVQCSSALHHNKTKRNYHIHLIYSERTLLEQKEIKRASRNMFYNEDGKHVRTKKEILDADGNVRAGCYIIPKGEIYEMNYFASKEEHFKSSAFLPEVKHLYTDLINSLVKDEAEKLTVFDSKSPYLATKKIGKNNPMAEVIQADNEARQEWNRAMDETLVVGIPSEEIQEMKKEVINIPVKESIQQHGQMPGLLRQILSKAVKLLLDRIRAFQMPSKKELKIDMDVFQEMQTVKKKLDGIQKEIQGMDVLIRKKQNRLDSITGIAGAFKLKEKKQLMNEISELLAKRKVKSELLHKTVSGAGYRSVDSFMKAFNKSHALVEEYLQTTQEAKVTEKQKSCTITQLKKERKSVLEKLHRYDEEAKRRQETVNHKHNKRNNEIDI